MNSTCIINNAGSKTGNLWISIIYYDGNQCCTSLLQNSEYKFKNYQVCVVYLYIMQPSYNDNIEVLSVGIKLYAIWNSGYFRNRNLGLGGKSLNFKVK